MTIRFRRKVTEREARCFDPACKREWKGRRSHGTARAHERKTGHPVLLASTERELVGARWEEVMLEIARETVREWQDRN
jgi:uncharacterized protein (DUF4415 family)